MSNRPGRKMSRRQSSGKSHPPKGTSTHSTKRRWLAVGGASLLVVLLVAAIAAVATSSGDDPGPPINLALSLDEFTITGDLESESGNIVLDLSNEGGAVHNVVVRGETRSRDLQPGETQSLEVGTLGSGTYELFCDIPGHTEAGMVAALTLN